MRKILWAFPYGSGYSLQWLARTSQTISTAIPNALSTKYKHQSLLGNCLRKKKLSVFERNAADFAAIMGFTAKNLTKLQPKTLIFSIDYKSPTGS
jgi:hypothetical protein